MGIFRDSDKLGRPVLKKDREDAAAVGYFVHVFVDQATGKAAAVPGRIRACAERLMAPARAAL